MSKVKINLDLGVDAADDLQYIKDWGAKYRAVIIQYTKYGPGGGNPNVTFEVEDLAHAQALFKDYDGGNGEQISDYIVD